jgi:hypothetical protein
MRTDCSDSIVTQLGPDDGHPGWLAVTSGGVTTVPVSSSWPDNMEQYRGIIESAAVEHGVPSALVAGVVIRESMLSKSLHPDAVSPAGARGLMQIMPAYASGMAGRHVDPDELFDPATNVWIGTRFLSQLLDKYDGNVIAVLSAYNSGGVRCGQCKCWSESGCASDPFGLRTDCGYVLGALKAHNAAAEHGFSPWIGSAPGSTSTATKLAAAVVAAGAVVGLALAARHVGWLPRSP